MTSGIGERDRNVIGHCGDEHGRRLSSAVCRKGTRAVHLRTFVAVIALAVGPLTVNALDLSGLPASLAEKVTVARQACESFGNGEFALEWGAVTRTDLDGDVHPDWVLDESGFACSTAASLYCGTGGCVSHFLIGNVVTPLRNHGWTVIAFGSNRVLLTEVHGSNCGAINPTPCFVAHVWDARDKVWRSVSVPDRKPR